MARFTRLTSATARGKAAELLADLEARHDDVGEMAATMAHSPSVLGGYLQLSRAMKRAKLDRRVSELISLAVQEQLGCQRCLAAHRDAARALGVSDEEIARARRGDAADPTVAAMVAFGLAVFLNPTSITDAQIEALRALGYSDRAITDVVGVVALNVLTGGFNVVAGLEGRPVTDTTIADADA